MSDVSNAAPAAPAPVDSSAPVEATEEVVDTGDDLPPELEEKPTDSKADKAAKKDARKKYELMVNGKKKDVELDFDNDEEVKKYLQKAFASDEKFQEAAMTRKQAEQLVEMLRTNPLQILRHPELGLDIKALATSILNEEIEEMGKTPEQKRMEELERKLAEKENREKELEKQKQEAELERFRAETYQQLDDDITSALSSSDLPKSPYVIKRIADAMMEAVDVHGYTDVRVQDIMPYVEQQILSEIQQMFEAKPADVMEKIIGKKNLDSYRKSKISKSRKPVETAESVKDSGGSKADSKKVAAEDKVTFKKMFGNW